MADTTPITLFGMPLNDLADPTVAAGAFYHGEEEINPAELAALIENAGAITPDLLGKLREAGLNYIQTGGKQRLRAILYGIDKRRWLQIRERVRQTLTHPHFRLFAPSSDLRIVQGGYEGKIRKAFDRIVVKALFDDATALDHLRQIAGSQSKMAMAAQIVLDRWEKLTALALETDPLTFAKKSAAICREEHGKILDEIEKRTTPPELLGQKLLGLHYGLSAAIDGMNDKNLKERGGWRHEGAQAVLHDRVARVLNFFELVASQMVRGKWDVAKAFFRLQTHRDDFNRLITVIYSAEAENMLLAAAKGVTMGIHGVPDHITIKEDHAPILEEALIELIYNAIKYSDEGKDQRRIDITWREGRQTITVADNGIGIRDSKVIWEEGTREAPAYAHGTGFGLSLVKRKLEAIGWKIAVESTPGIGTTFTLTPPKGAIQYKEFYLASLLQEQRRHFEAEGQFDLAVLIPQVVALMTQEEQLMLSKQLVTQMEIISADFVQAIGELAENDFSGLERLNKTLHFELNRLVNLYPKPADEKLKKLMDVLASSTPKQPQFLRDHASGIITGVRKMPWKKAIAFIQEANNEHKNTLGSGHGFSSSFALKEATNIFVWNVRIQKAEESWQNNQWILRFPLTLKSEGFLLPFALWPLDPEGDLALKTYLEILGWRMTVSTSGEQIEVRIDFGKNAI